MKKLDRSKPFGTVHGVAAYAFEQAGVMFDHDGNEVGGQEEPKAKEPKAKARPEPEPKPEMDPQLASQLQGE